MVQTTNVLSDVGKARLKAYLGLLSVNIIVLALSARVNQFQDFFYMADLFPLGLSIATLIVLSIVMMLDFAVSNPLTSQPPFEIGLLSIFSIFWLAFNAFSTMRWRHVPLACSKIPAEYVEERGWCRELQALKAFVWVEWVLVFMTTAFTVFYVVREHNKGNRHIWKTTLSRYYSHGRSNDTFSHRRASSYAWGTASANY